MLLMGWFSIFCVFWLYVFICSPICICSMGLVVLLARFICVPGKKQLLCVIILSARYVPVFMSTRL